MNNKGFTLPELLCSLAVISTLLVCAAPINVQLERYRLQTDAAELASALRHARTHAILGGTGVTILATDNDWSRGWRIFTDSNRNTLMDIGDRPVAIRALSGSSVMQGNRPMSHYVHFAPTGEPVQASGAFQAGTVVLCSSNSPDNIKIVLGKGGRVRVETVQTAQPCD